HADRVLKIRLSNPNVTPFSIKPFLKRFAVKPFLKRFAVKPFLKRFAVDHACFVLPQWNSGDRTREVYTLSFPC
ncbi:MAG: hypothetical protein PHE01_08390, partial [Methanosarcina sp.]|nr:hypothetical protein [Methanosarcina sp.]